MCAFYIKVQVIHEKLYGNNDNDWRGCFLYQNLADLFLIIMYNF